MLSASLLTESSKLCPSFLAWGAYNLCRSFLWLLVAPFFPESGLFTDMLLSGNSLVVGVCKQQEKATWPLLTASFPLRVPTATRWSWDNATSFLQETTVASCSADPLWSSWECNFSASPLLSLLPLSYLQRAGGPELVPFQTESIILHAGSPGAHVGSITVQAQSSGLPVDAYNMFGTTLSFTNYLWYQCHSFSNQTNGVLVSYKSSGKQKTKWSESIKLASSLTLIWSQTIPSPQHDSNHRQTISLSSSVDDIRGNE